MSDSDRILALTGNDTTYQYVQRLVGSVPSDPVRLRFLPVASQRILGQPLQWDIYVNQSLAAAWGNASPEGDGFPKGFVAHLHWDPADIGFVRAEEHPSWPGIIYTPDRGGTATACEDGTTLDLWASPDRPDSSVVLLWQVTGDCGEGSDANLGLPDYADSEATAVPWLRLTFAAQRVGTHAIQPSFGYIFGNTAEDEIWWHQTDSTTRFDCGPITVVQAGSPGGRGDIALG